MLFWARATPACASGLPDGERGRHSRRARRHRRPRHALGDRASSGSGRAPRGGQAAHRRSRDASRRDWRGKPLSSSRQRRSSMQRPVLDPADDRQGSRRNAAASAVSARPLPRAGRAGSPARRSARVSSGSAPEPIWLAQAIDLDRDMPRRAARRPPARAARASASISGCGRASRRRVGSRSASRSGSR